jgi:hypothetical protein
MDAEQAKEQQQQQQQQQQQHATGVASAGQILEDLL